MIKLPTKKKMAKRKGCKTQLNLHNTPLYGFQNICNKILVDAVVRGIRAGDSFEPVFVCRRDQASYALYSVGGGHHRAIGHYIAKAPLTVIIMTINPEWLGVMYPSLSPIKDVELYDHREVLEESGLLTKDFHERWKDYPRIAWKKWGLTKPRETAL